MKKNLREIVAYGICTFGAGIDRDSNGYGHIKPTQPVEACSEPCDYCWHQAEHILKTIEDVQNGKQQSDQIFSREDREIRRRKGCDLE